MNLEEKAKTYLEIEMWAVEQTLECRPYDEELHEERMKVKWVLLSDAQQEIDAHGRNNEALAKVCYDLSEKVARFDVLKQKLRECKDLLDNRPQPKDYPKWKDKRHTKTTYFLDVNEEWFRIFKKKFKELLKK